MGPKPSKIGRTGQNEVKKEIQSTTGDKPKGRLKKFRQEAIFDDLDDRTGIEDDPIQFIGLIRSKFKSNHKVTIGTGVIISDDLVLTVAHNVCFIKSKKKKQYNLAKQSQIKALSSSLASTLTYSNKLSTMNWDTSNLGNTTNIFETYGINHAEFAQWIEFYPSINGQFKGLETRQDAIQKRNNDGNFHKIKQFKVHPSFITEIDNNPFDICLIQLEKPLQLKQKIRIIEGYSDYNTQISVYGYPTDLNFKSQQQPIKMKQFGATGSFKVNEDSGYINYKIATNNGQSGSPIFINTTNNGKPQRFCIGIHKGESKNTDTNVGIHLTEEKMKFIAEAEEELTGKLSKNVILKLPKLPENSIPNLPPKNVNQKSIQEYISEFKKAQNHTSIEKMPKKIIYYYQKAAYLSMLQQNYLQSIKFYEQFIHAIELLSSGSQNEDDQNEYQAALINLAKCYCEQGQYQISYDIYTRVEKKCRQFCNLSLQKESIILNNKGAVLVHLGRYEEALENFKTSYNLRRSKFGDENLMTYNSLENVTSMKFKLGIDLNDCVKDYEKVLKFKERKYGIGSKQSLKSKQNLAIMLFELKNYKQSLNNFYFCMEKYCLLKERGIEVNTYNIFTKQFVAKLRELCKLQSSLDDLKQAFQICQHYGELKEVSKELDDQWSKRKAVQKQ